jgi:hypothetical protein
MGVGEEEEEEDMYFRETSLPLWKSLPIEIWSKSNGLKRGV